MAKSAKTAKQGFVIKLSCETAQKISEEEQKLKLNEDALKVNVDNKIDSQNDKIHEVIPTTITKDKQSIACPVNDDSLKVNVDSKIDNQNNKIHEVIQTTITKDKQSIACAVNDVSKSKTHAKSIESWGQYAPYVTYEEEDAFYTDPNTNKKYKWNQTNNAWDCEGDGDVSGRQYSYEEDTHVYTDSDGSKFFWDHEKKAWIPKVDSDFLALYQMSYGFVDNAKPKEISEEKTKTEKKQETNLKRKSEPQWFQPSDENNTKVYVSDLPLDTTEEEFVDLMQKYGLVERDPSTQKMKVKLYMDKEQNCFKGDALCTYIKIESVNLALNLLDGSDFNGNKIKVEKAHFQLKGEYNPSLKPKKKKKKELEKIKKIQQKLFDWRPEKFLGERAKHERVVIVKNLFHPSDFDKEVQLILDYQQDLREECGKCGDVRKVVIYDGHPEGVAQITMKEPQQADEVIQLINGRWFGKRQITAEIWDGRTKYKIAETDADISKRINKWDKFLDQEEKKGNEEDVVSSSQEKIISDETSN